jgi:carbon-monoxide dehydrogenase iron sulfur subunit
MDARRNMRLERNPELCHGCRTCELMCSFHHHRIMAPDKASIQVIRRNFAGAILWSVDSSCDLCLGEDGPFCVKYCPYEALRSVTR